MIELDPILAREAAEVERELDLRLGAPRPDDPAPRLVEAMRHSLLGGGKRLRAVLCLWVNDATPIR